MTSSITNYYYTSTKLPVKAEAHTFLYSWLTNTLPSSHTAIPPSQLDSEKQTNMVAKD